MLTVNDIEWEIECLPEDTSIEGNVMASGDDEADRKAEQLVIDQLDSGNEWAWCTVRVSGRYMGLEAYDFLGCCSYLSIDDFKLGGYFEDMQSVVLDELNAMVNKIKQA